MSGRLDREYRQTVYWVFGPHAYIGLRVEQTSPELDRLLEEAGALEWAHITAWNPRSRPLSPPDNRQAQDALEWAVRARYSSLPGVGAATDGDWPPEEGLFIFGIPEAEAVELGRRFEQNAVVCGRKGEPARLVWCFPPGEPAEPSAKE